MTLTVDQAAQQGSQLTGLPFAFVKALIVEEGSAGSGNWVNGSIVNNPFDVTTDWARQVGQGGNVTGGGGSQGNIASFNDPSNAVTAWALGILNFGNYAGLRDDLATGGTYGQLATDLANAGYASGSSTFVGNVVALAEQFAGQGAPPTQIPPVGPLPGGQQVSGAIAGVGNTINNAVGGVKNAVNSVTSKFTNLNDLVQLLGIPSFWTHALMVAAGGAILLLGLILFGVSLLPKDTGGKVLHTVGVAA